MRSMWSLVLLIGLAGCQPAIAPAPVPSPPTQVAGYTFEPLSIEQLGILGRSGGPAITSVATPVAYGTYKIYQGGHSGHWGSTILPGAFLPDSALVATSLTGDFGPGFTGTPQAAIETVVKPLVGAWAADAQLVTQYKSVPRNVPYQPEQITDEASILTHIGWPLTYTSPARRENLAVWVEAERTFVARTTWAPAATAIAVNEARAIELLKAALQDPGFQSVEEKSRRDAFLGLTLELAPPGEPKSSDFIARSEPVVGVPPNVEWQTMRMDVLGRAVWFVSVKNGTQVFEGPRVYVDQNAAGWIDAQTGEVLRFRRMVRETYKDDAPVAGS